MLNLKYEPRASGLVKRNPGFNKPRSDCFFSSLNMLMSDVDEVVMALIVSSAGTTESALSLFACDAVMQR